MRKTISLIIFTVLLTVSGNAQSRTGNAAANPDCVKYLSFYQQYMKQGDIEQASPLWRKAFAACPPSMSQNMLIDGLKIVRKDILANKNNPERVRELVDTVKILHQLRIENYPKYSVQAYSAMSLDYLNYLSQSDPVEVFDALTVAMGVTGNKTPVPVPVQYVTMAVKLHENGTFDAEKLIGAYATATDVLGQILTGTTDDTVRESAQNAIVHVDNMFSLAGVAGCKELVSIYGPKYEANPEDKVMLSTVVSIFASQKCFDEDLFRQAVESLHKQESSFTSAKFLYKLCSNAGDYDKAGRYLNEAVSYPECDARSRASLYYEYAAHAFTKSGNLPEAYGAALKAEKYIQDINDSEMLGRLYLLMAQMWSTARCGGNEIDARAPYWMAVDYLIKARNASESLTEEANKLIGQYSTYFPAQSDAFMYDLKDGDSYSVNCGGMNGTTRVRTRK